MAVFELPPPQSDSVSRPRPSTSTLDLEGRTRCVFPLRTKGSWLCDARTASTSPGIREREWLRRFGVAAWRSFDAPHSTPTPDRQHDQDDRATTSSDSLTTLCWGVRLATRGVCRCPERVVTAWREDIRRTCAVRCHGNLSVRRSKHPFSRLYIKRQPVALSGQDVAKCTTGKRTRSQVTDAAMLVVMRVDPLGIPA